MSPAKRSSPTISDLRMRVIACLNKLSDRDTASIAATELDSIAKSLPESSFSTFIACIASTDSSSKSPVRKHSVNLLALLAISHGDALSKQLPKMVSAAIRRLRDGDAAVRSACVAAIAAMAAKITSPAFSSAFLGPLVEAMATENEAGAQAGAAMCLAAAVEAAPEVEGLQRALPRLGRLARSEGFKGKAALVGLVGSIVSVGGASGRGVLDWWVPCMVGFLGVEEWAVRKAAAEALGRVAVVERELAGEYRAECLASLERRRFDKVKIVRETMNRTLELWKAVPGGSEEVSAPSGSSKSSMSDNRSGSCSPPVSKSPRDTGFRTPRKKKTVPTNRSPPSDSSFSSIAKKGSPLRSTERNSNTVALSKQDHKKPLNSKAEVTQTQSPPLHEAWEDDIGAANFGGKENGGSFRLETRRSLFSKTGDEKIDKSSCWRSGSRVVPFDDDMKNSDSDNLDHAASEEVYDTAQDNEDLALIRKQLLQIENQQCNLLELLQRFVGSSKSGINSLETRVRDIETALDEISYNLAVSRRIPNPDFADDTCCKLPGTEFLSSKFWRKTEERCSNSRFSSGDIQTLNAMHSTSDQAYTAESHKLDNHKNRHQNWDGSYISADVCSESLEFYSNRMPKKTVYDAERAPCHSDLSPAICVQRR